VENLHVAAQDDVGRNWHEGPFYAAPIRDKEQVR
jgi:hypothetical protein